MKFIEQVGEEPRIQGVAERRSHLDSLETAVDTQIGNATLRRTMKTTRVLTIPYPDDLLLSLKESPAQFEEEARLLLAVKLFELGKVSSGMAARLAGLPRVAFLLALKRFQLSPFGQEPGELADDVAHA